MFWANDLFSGGNFIFEDNFPGTVYNLRDGHGRNTLAAVGEHAKYADHILQLNLAAAKSE